MALVDCHVDVRDNWIGELFVALYVAVNGLKEVEESPYASRFHDGEGQGAAGAQVVERRVGHGPSES